MTAAQFQSQTFNGIKLVFVYTIMEQKNRHIVKELGIFYGCSLDELQTLTIHLYLSGSWLLFSSQDMKVI